jgi:hypothetical protein
VTGQADAGISWLQWVQERMLSCSRLSVLPLNAFRVALSTKISVVTIYRLPYYIKWPLPPGDNRTTVNKFYYNGTTDKEKKKCHTVWPRGPILDHRYLVTCSEFTQLVGTAEFRVQAGVLV